MILDLLFHKSQTKMFAVSHFLFFVLRYIVSLSEILRSYLETGMTISEYYRPIITEFSCTGEYIFDFAVVILGVRSQSHYYCSFETHSVSALVLIREKAMK